MDQLVGADQEMSHRAPSRLEADTAREVCARYPCSDVAGFLLKGHLQGPPNEFLDVLLDRGLYPDAVDFLGHALRVRAAVWWGCLGIRHALGTNLGELESAALFRAGDWVVHGSADARARAKLAAEGVDRSSPTHFVALAAAQSNHKEPSAADSICTAIKLLAANAGAKTDDIIMRQLLMIGLGVAEGDHGWNANDGR